MFTERSRDDSLRFLSQFHPDIVMEHIDHDYLSTQVIQIPYKSKNNAKPGANDALTFSQVSHAGRCVYYTNVPPRSGA